MDPAPENDLNEADDPFEQIGLFYVMEHDSIHQILENNNIDYEIEIFDGTSESHSRGSSGLKTQFALYIHKNCMDKALALLEKHLPH
jgi:hypothetical protein